MNEIDDKAFDEYVERASSVSRHYRELPAGEMPPALDERVLREARAAVSKKPTLASKSRALARWSVPLALAASVVLVVTVIRDTDMQKRAAPSVEELPSAPPEQYEADRDATAAPPAAPLAGALDAPPSTAAPKPQFVPEPKREAESVVVSGNRIAGTPEDAALPVEVVSSDRLVAQPKLADVAPQAPAPAAAVDSAAVEKRTQELRRDARAEASGGAIASNSTVVEEAVVTGTLRQRAVQTGAGPRGTVTPALSSSRAAAADAQATPAWEADPRAWLEHIRELRKQNAGAAADREWKRFVDAYPEFEVAENDAARPRKQ